MLDSLKPDQERALSEFRRILKDEIPTEMYNDTILLTKFLKARNFNLKQAESMIKKNVLWRKEMQIDTILTDFKLSEVAKKYMSSQYIGFDKEGSPIRYTQVGTIDTEGLHKSTNIMYLLKTLIFKCEEELQLQKSQCKKLGKSVVQGINMYDVAHLSLAQIRHVEAIQFLLRFLRIVQANYPEIVKRVIIINASGYFATVLPVLQKCMASELIQKFSVYSQDGWKEELLRIMDADTLPAFLGGNLTDPDGNPLCLNLVNHLSGPIPKKYYLEKSVTKFSQKPGVKSVRIDRQDQVSESIQVTEWNSIINWEFLIKNYDIGFGILLETEDGRQEELIPVHKIETELESYIGMYRCKKTGKHMIVFDNSYSWFHTKEVYFRIWVSNAEEI